MCRDESNQIVSIVLSTVLTIDIIALLILLIRFKFASNLLD